ncbi:MAG: hypothetical protein II306_09800, partial [Clostridia bacterium]|nr:hypothetical protein [Clostridia bacterium]
YLLHKGFVFYVDCAGSLTITDSSEAQTGTITGGKNAWLWGPLEARLNGCGGAFHVEYGTLYIKGGNITGNIATYGGAIYINDVSDAAVHISGGKIYGNTAEEGGAIYANNGYLYVDGGEITGNTAEYGGGIYWDSLDAGYFTGGKIYGNTATEKGGGMYVESYSDTYYGGDIQIFGNTNGNLYLDNPDILGDNTSQIFNACGQNGSPNKPLTDGAYIGIHVSNINKQLTGFTSRFNEGDFRYFHPDISSYFIRSVYKPNGEGNDHRLYFNTWGHEDARYPRVKSVSVKDSNLLTDAVLDYDTQTITLTAHNTRKNFFERAVLSDIIECTYDKDIYYLYQMDYMRDLREPQEYKIMSDNGTYVLCKVNVVPEGGKWADEQESVDSPYKMIVKVGASSKGFNDFGEGWTYAVSQDYPAAITLFADWNATDGEFDYSEGTKGGALYIDRKDITIDLNGNTINRGLTESDSDGHVFWLVGGAKLTINDSSDACSGKITGAYGSGNGGAFYVDYGKLYINGGEISGNQAKNGGAIYSTNENDSFIYINGGKITGNTATENGGAIFMEEGFLYMDSGEISGNYATNNGGGIYWNSENKLCLTGGKITGNKAKEGGGVYGTDWGKMYVGGTIVVKDNLITNTLDQNNFFLSDTDVYLNNAAEQSQIPNKPLTDGACVGIHGAEADTLISSPDSRFNVDSAKYFKADHDMYWVYGWYDASGGNNTYKLYYNFDALGSELPRIKSVESKSDLVQASLNSDSYAITLTADMKVKKLGTLENAKLSELIDATFNRDGVQIMNFD